MTQHTTQLMKKERVDEEVTRLADQSLFESNWTRPLRATPVAITLLGECMITASMNKAYLLDIEGPSIGKLPLPTCLMECPNLGLETFTQAQVRMHKMGIKAISTAGSRQTLDKIVAIVNGNDSSPKVRKNLNQQLKDLKAAAELCQTESAKIQEYIEKWAKYTQEIGKGTSMKRGTLEKDTERVESESTKSKLAKEKADAAKSNADKEVADAARIYKGMLEKRAKTSESFDKNIATGVVLTILNVGLGATYLFGTVVNSVMAEYNLEEAEALQKKQERAQEEARARQQDILHELQLLRKQEDALDQFTVIANRAIRDLQLVQNNVAQLLTFFSEVANNVQILIMDCHNSMHGELEGSLGDFIFDEETRTNIRDRTLALKACFIYIGTVCGAYTDISKNYILPGLETANRLALGSSSLSEEERSRQLNREYTQSAVIAVDQITEKKERDLESKVRGVLMNSVMPELLGPGENS